MFSSMFIALVSVLIAFIAFQLLNGGIYIGGLFSSGPGQAVQADRVQSLFVAMATLGSYAGAALVAGPVDTLPEVPAPLLFAFGGSQVLYLSGKFIRTLR